MSESVKAGASLAGFVSGYRLLGDACELPEEILGESGSLSEMADRSHG